MKYCPFRVRVSAFVDREVAPQERQEIMHHLEKCKECRRFFDDVKKIRFYLQLAGDIKLDAQFNRKVMRRVVESERNFLIWERIEYSLQKSFIALAFFVFLIIAISLLRDQRSNIHQPLATMSDSTLSVFSFQPVEVSNQDIAYAAFTQSR